MAASKAYFTTNCSNKLKSYKKCHCCHKKGICLYKKSRYNLTHPKPHVTERIAKFGQANMLENHEATSKLKNRFKGINPHNAKSMGRKIKIAACRIAAKKTCKQGLPTS